MRLTLFSSGSEGDFGNAIVTNGIIIFLLTFVVMLLELAFTFKFIGLHIYDASEYSKIALNLLDGNGYTLEPEGALILWRPPLYPFFLAGIYSIFGYWHLPVLLIQVIINAMTCTITWYLATNIFNKRTGTLSAVCLAFHPLFVFNGSSAMTESLFTFLLALVVLFLFKSYQSPLRRYFILAGCFIGLASLCRASAQFLSVFIFVVLFIKTKQRRIAFVKNYIFLLISMVLIVSPWTLRNYIVSGGEVIPIDTSKGYTFWEGNQVLTDGHDLEALSREKRLNAESAIADILGIANEPDGTGNISRIAWSSKRNSDKLFNEAVQNIYENPIEVVDLLVKKSFRFWFSFIEHKYKLQYLIILYHTILVSLGIMGLYRSCREHRPVLVLTVIILYFYSIHILSIAYIRYSVPIIPYIIIFACCGALHIGNSIASRFSKNACIPKRLFWKSTRFS